MLDVQLNSMTVSIYLKENHSMKYHSHEQRSEIWTIVSGNGYVVVDGEKKLVKPETPFQFQRVQNTLSMPRQI